MKRQLEQMATKEYDVLIIGGGINGTAVARDAALRGLRTALVEKEDFGYGTTSRSTRLIHGGLRYLEHFDFGLVREGLREREVLLKTAPHLVKPLPFLVPVYKGDRVGIPKLRAGMILYDLLSWDKSMPSHRFLKVQEALEKEPLLNSENLVGAMVYYDGQVEMPERVSVENVLQAAEHGADIANHALVEKYLMDGARVVGARVRDLLTDKVYDVKAKFVVNAAGPWIDEMNSKLLEKYRPRMRLTKGIHLLIPQIVNHAIVLLAQSDGRLFFAVPYQGYTLIGTTDTDYAGDLDDIRATRDEVEYLVAETRRVFPSLPTDEIYYTTAGLRPLVRVEGKSEGATSRKHKIVDHAQDGYDGLLSLLGGKITSQRFFAEQTVDLITKRMGLKVPSPTRTKPFYGGDFDDLTRLQDEVVREYEGKHGLTEEQIRRVVGLYGSKGPGILEMAASDGELAKPVTEGSPVLTAEVAYSVEHEMAVTTTDFLMRRSGLGLVAGQGMAEAPHVAAILGRLLGRDAEEVARDLEEYKAYVAMMQEGIEKRPVSELAN